MQVVCAAVSVLVVLGMTRKDEGCLGLILQDSERDTQRNKDVTGSSKHSQDPTPQQDSSGRIQSIEDTQRKLEMAGSLNYYHQYPSGYPPQDSLEIPSSTNTNQTKYPQILRVLNARSPFPSLQDSLEPPEIPLNTKSSYRRRPKVLEVLNASRPNSSLPSSHLQQTSSFETHTRKGFNNTYSLRSHTPQKVNGNVTTTSSFTSFINGTGGEKVSESKSETSPSYFKTSFSEFKSRPEARRKSGKSNLSSPSSSSSSIYIPSNTSSSSLRERIVLRHPTLPPPNLRSTSSTPTDNLHFPNWERAKEKVVTTQGNYSRVYRLPSYESSLSLLGVRSSGEVRIGLLDVNRDEAPLNITLYSSPDGESEIHFNNSFGSHVIVSRHKLKLSPDTYTWLVIFRKDTVVYVYLADKYDPFLVYDHLGSEGNQLQLLQYSRFQVWSRGKAYWDLVGTHYKNENKYTNLQEKGLKEELDGIKEGLAERFALMTNLVSFLQRPKVINNMSLPDIQQMSDLGTTVEPLRNLLYFFGFLDDKKMHWTSI